MAAVLRRRRSEPVQQTVLPCVLEVRREREGDAAANVALSRARQSSTAAPKHFVHQVVAKMRLYSFDVLR